MAGGQERILKGRISSMQATKKITRAMELIAASRIVKAQQRVEAAVPYSEQITEVVRDLSAAGASSDSPLLAGRPDRRTKCYVVVTADRGLCGAYNANVQRAAEGEVKADVQKGLGYEIIPVGKRAESYFRFREYDLGRAFQGFSEAPSYDDAKAIGQHVTELFLDGTVDSVELIYTRFISAGSQEVVLRPLVPLTTETAEGGDGLAGEDGSAGEYEFEPDPTTILETLLPRYIEARVYAALLNAAASEHAFRQRAMKSATDNAEDLITQLSIIMNRARQDSITTEIMEIVGGAEALSGGGEDNEYFVDEPDWVATPTEPSGVTATLQRVVGNPLGIKLADTDSLTDDLTRISGIGEALRDRLYEVGVTTYRQIAEWVDHEVERINEYFEFPGRVEREGWVAQARDLLGLGDQDDD